MRPREALEQARALRARGELDLAGSVAIDAMTRARFDEPTADAACALAARCARERARDPEPGARPRRAAREAFLRLADACEAIDRLEDARDALLEARAAGAERAALAAPLARLSRARWGGALRALGLAALAAILVLLGTPPVSSTALGLLGVTLLLLVARESSTTRALGLGWLVGFVVNLVGFSWGAGLLRRFLHLGATSGAAWVAALAAYQACVFALWLGGATLLRRRVGVPMIVAAPLAIAIVEGTIPFLFPWFLALIAAPTWPLAQLAELGGPPAVSALLVAIGALAAEAIGLGLLRSARTAKAAAWLAVRKPADPRALRIGLAAITVVVALGLGRAAQVASARRSARVVRVGAVQPNVGITPPKQRAQRADQELAVLRGATARAAGEGADLVVWPESAFPFLFDRDQPREYPEGHPWALHPGHRGRLLFGALTHTFGTGQLFNSAVLVRRDGAVAGIYDKNQLLAFGEYVPFADRSPAWAAEVRAKLDDFPPIVPGSRAALLVDGDLRIAPLICYEDLLPEQVQATAALGANLLVTSANHAWFDGSLAPRQAEQLALFRAIEARRDLVRATSTGVSSISDALGRVLREGSEGGVVGAKPPDVLVADVALLELPALGPRTARHFPLACALGLGLAVVVTWRRRRAATAR